MIGIILALAAAAAPAAPATAPVPPPPPGAARGAAAMKALGMSDQGIAVLRAQSAPDPDAKAIVAKARTLRGQLVAAAAAQPFDLDAVTALLRESSQLEATVRTRNEERIVTTLKALPAADRAIFARAVFAGPPQPPGAVPAPPRP